MLIRHANDGKMYLYDILDIKKETIFISVITARKNIEFTEHFK
jgi:hypothetical protein